MEGGKRGGERKITVPLTESTKGPGLFGVASSEPGVLPLFRHPSCVFYLRSRVDSGKEMDPG